MGASVFEDHLQNIAVKGGTIRTRCYYVLTLGNLQIQFDRSRPGKGIVQILTVARNTFQC